MSEQIALPSARALRGVLRKITERLAEELARPSPFEPDWSTVEWRLARAVAAMHGVSPLLATRLRWQGPQDWRSFLNLQRAHVAIRHQRIEELLRDIDAHARDQEVPVVALKGAELHAMGLYVAGERPMADVDLLIRSGDASRAARVLQAVGFRETYATWKHRVFAPKDTEVHAVLGEHAQNPLKIELHDHLAEALPLHRVDITDSAYPREMSPGVNRYPSKAALMNHLAIHAAGAMAFRVIRLLQLHDLALLSSRMTSSDWEELLQQGRRGGPWWVLPPLQLTARYYTSLIPSEVLTALSKHCHWNLRRIARVRTLSDVSLSYPRIEAFPGIGWSRTWGEFVHYAATRIRPDKELFRLRKVMVETQVAASMTEWGRLSQGRRLVRWLTSIPTRIDTLHAVQTALRQQH